MILKKNHQGVIQNYLNKYFTNIQENEVVIAQDITKDYSVEATKEKEVIDTIAESSDKQSQFFIRP